MKRRKKTKLLYVFIVIVILLASLGLGLVIQKQSSDRRKKEAESILKLYKNDVELTMKEKLNYALELADMDVNIWKYPEIFEQKAQKMMEREGVQYILLFKGDTVEKAFPSDSHGGELGKDLHDFSYLYTMAKVVKEPVAEGPVPGQGADSNVFLFIAPLLEGGEYKGEIAVALQESYVIEQLKLDQLYDMGYEYHLWKVDSQDGSKSVIAYSDRHLDFSNAAKEEITLPTLWTISILPREGWVSLRQRVMIIIFTMVLGSVLSAFIISTSLLVNKNKMIKNRSFVDPETELFNRNGFCVEMQKWIDSEDCNFTIFYFCIEEYSRISLIAGVEKEAAYLKSLAGIIAEFIRGPYVAGRIAEGSFVVAVKEEMREQEKLDFAKGLALKMMWKVRIHGEKLFLNVRYQYVSYPSDGERAEELIHLLIDNYCAKLSQESPIHDLTEKCRLLVEGRTDVEFSQYTDFRMMELSKVLNQYRKQVEQLVYYDTVYHIGNRMKYIRDVDLLIAYDPKRRFRLYGIDIRSFSKYNELFSVTTGDALLKEMSLRLSDIFGTNLYRINGDVFMGLSFGERYKSYKEDEVVDQILKAFRRPVLVEDAAFTMDALIGICDYPVNAKTSQKLLECVQSAINYAKIPENKVVDGIMVYNEKLSDIGRREAQILRLLKDSISDHTLEVWYQPMYELSKKRFTAVEALVRLPDGFGGYIPASQAIEIAEKNGIVSQVGEYVMSHACTFMSETAQRLGIEKMGINLSVQQLLVEDSVAKIMRQILKSGVAPEAVTLEITETVLIQSIEKAEGILKELSEFGVGIALDDFGIGYSSLNYLLNLPVDSLKIDRSMTMRITSSRKQYALLETIIEMADLNNIKVVVEGVETEEELQMIASTSASFIQGFYYSKPLPETEFKQFLLKHMEVCSS